MENMSIVNSSKLFGAVWLKPLTLFCAQVKPQPDKSWKILGSHSGDPSSLGLSQVRKYVNIYQKKEHQTRAVEMAFMFHHISFLPGQSHHVVW